MKSAILSVCILGTAFFSCNLNRSIAQQTQTREHPLLKPIQYAKAAQARVQALTDYEADFTKREVVGRRMLTQHMLVRVRHQPFSVYMKYKDPNPGRQIWYVANKNNGKLHVKLTGLLAVAAGPLDLAPTDPKALEENRHPITMMGMDRTLAQVIKQWELESKYGEIDVKYHKQATIKNPQLGDVPCRVIVSSHPRPRRQFRFQQTRLYLEKKNNLPIRIEQYGFAATPNGKSPLVEQYTYWRVRPNRGLTARDFSY